MQKERFSVSSAFLHIFAMACMLLDHIWGVGLAGGDWMTCVGRLAFPVFAFMIAEGWRRTSNQKRYAKRLLIAAVCSEIPFNLMVSGLVFYPLAQNVLWTFLIAIGAMWWIDSAKAKYQEKPWKIAAVTVLALLLGYALGFVSFADYFGMGVLTVLAFYLFPERKPLHMLLQLAGMYLIHSKMLGGMTYIVELGGFELGVHRQSLALLALIPIWLYRGRQGYHAGWFQWFCYAFYPAHMLLLYLLAVLL